jgi:penicillin-binding protein 1A
MTYFPLTKKRLCAACGLSALVIFASLSLYVSRFLDSTPNEFSKLGNFDGSNLDLATEFYDRNGHKIGEIAEESRYFLGIDDVPVHVINAFTSAEDKSFFNHHGINPTAIARAVYKNLVRGHISQGASTITQQLARILFLSKEKTYTRKLKEALLAIGLERRFTKREILERYLNRIFLGNRSYGVEAAARNYFRKSAKDLTVGEAAMLAGLPKAPSKYAINRNYQGAKRRQIFVLTEMHANGYLTKEEFQNWKTRPVAFFGERVPVNQAAFYFLTEVKKEVARKFAGYSKIAVQGLKIFTTLDPQLQAAAERIGKAAIERRRDSKGSNGPPKQSSKGLESASLSLNTDTGAILAIQGGNRFSNSQFDRAFNMKRQLGEIFLPVYLGIALECGFTLATPVDSDLLANPSQKPMHSIFPTIYDVLTQSDVENGVVLMAALGVGTVSKYLKKIGFRFQSYDLRLGLGRGQASPLELARAYSIFANGGHTVTPYLVSEIRDFRGRVLYKHELGARDAVVRSETSEILTKGLKDNIKYGDGKLLLGTATDLAGSIGISSDLKNGWVVAYRGNTVTTIWLGNDWERQAIATDRAAAYKHLALLWSKFAAFLPSVGAKDIAINERLSYFQIKVEKEDGTFVKRTLPFEIGSKPPQTHF